MRKYFFRNPTILHKRLLMLRFSSFFSSSSPCNSFPNCCLPILRELYFGIYRTFCVLSPKAAGQFYCSYFSCHMFKNGRNIIYSIWCSSRFWNYQRKFFSHGEALIGWGSHQTTALVVCKSFLFSTVDLLGGTDKPTCTKCSKWLDKNFLNYFEKCKNNNTSTKFSCAPAQVAID